MAKITPYKNTKSKKEQIATMFNNIAENYDFLNHSLSFGMDNVWRKRAILEINKNAKAILDVATGTADFAIIAAKHTKAQITGIDISQGMLNIGAKKITKEKLSHRISLKKADSEDIPFKNNSFDAITAGFGIRNFDDLRKGLKEIKRVLRVGGTIAILEPSTPKYFPLKQLYKLYFHHLLPKIGSWISNDKDAYKYLPESVDAFPSGENFINLLKETGFKECKYFPLSLGIVSLYIAIK